MPLSHTLDKSFNILKHIKNMSLKIILKYVIERVCVYIYMQTEREREGPYCGGGARQQQVQVQNVKLFKNDYSIIYSFILGLRSLHVSPSGDVDVDTHRGPQPSDLGVDFGESLLPSGTKSLVFDTLFSPKNQITINLCWQ